jgi:hypothetical protein
VDLRYAGSDGIGGLDEVRTHINVSA